MNFQVPQFIEIEDKIVGPFTFKQFLYLAGGIGLSFILYAFLPLMVAIIPIIVVMALAISLTFFKINNRPFVFTLESAIFYFVRSKLYLWNKKPVKMTGGKKMAEVTTTNITRLSASRLADIAWNLDVKDKIQ
ncbi:MAG: PrgI family protein [Patescibacteria group bacterium]